MRTGQGKRGGSGKQWQMQYEPGLDRTESLYESRFDRTECFNLQFTCASLSYHTKVLTRASMVLSQVITECAVSTETTQSEEVCLEEGNMQFLSVPTILIEC